MRGAASRSGRGMMPLHPALYDTKCPLHGYAEGILCVDLFGSYLMA